MSRLAEVVDMAVHKVLPSLIQPAIASVVQPTVDETIKHATTDGPFYKDVVVPVLGFLRAVTSTKEKPGDCLFQEIVDLKEKLVHLEAADQNQVSAGQPIGSAWGRVNANPWVGSLRTPWGCK